ncbi:MAG: dTDP-4-dehydrorhamnose reductase [Paracoccaceae bacterium]
MTVLVFGKTGQVATELQRLGDVTALGRDTADLARPDDCAAAIRRLKPTAVINAAAYTAVDKAEVEETLATTINGAAPGAMARAAAELGIPLLHISSDYVFNGTGERPWLPEDVPGPLGAYGRSKLAGETAIHAAGGQWAVLRTSWVFSAHGSNFVKTMRRLGAERDTLRVVADQIGGPTAAADIASALLRMAEQMQADSAKGGTHHFSGTPAVSWAEFAAEIFAQAGLNVAVTPIPASEYPTPAQRPANSRLDCSSLMQEFGIAQPGWKASLAAVLAELN